MADDIVPDDLKMDQISVSTYNSAAINKDGRLFLWGSTSSGIILNVSPKLKEIKQYTPNEVSPSFILKIFEDQYKDHPSTIAKIKKRMEEYIFVHVSLSNHHGAALMMPNYFMTYSKLNKDKGLKSLRGIDTFDRESKDGIEKIIGAFSPILERKLQEGLLLFEAFGLDRNASKEGKVPVKLFLDKLQILYKEAQKLKETLKAEKPAEFFSEVSATVERISKTTAERRQDARDANFYQWAYTICPKYFEHTCLLSWGAVDDGRLGLGSEDSDFVSIDKKVEDKLEEAERRSLNVSIEQKMIGSQEPRRSNLDGSRASAIGGSFTKGKAMGFVEIKAFFEIYNKPLIFTKVSCGSNYTMAVASNGVLFCWGYEGQGCLGGAKPFSLKVKQSRKTFTQLEKSEFLNNSRKAETPSSSKGKSLHQISFSENPSHIELNSQNKKEDEEEEVIGNKDLGIPKYLDYLSFSGSGVQDVAAGFQHVLAVNRRNQLFSWGNGEQGSLGHGDFLPQSTPKQILHPNIQNVIYISAGQDYSAAINSDNALYTWGGGSFYRLGTGSDATRNEPSLVDAFQMERIYSVTCGSTCTFAINSDGKLYGWGSGIYGKLGIDHSGYNGIYPTPREVGRFNEKFIENPIKQVKSSINHTIAVNQVQELYSWGRRNRGVLGLGRRQTDQADPEKVEGFSSYLPINFSVNEIPKAFLDLWQISTIKNTPFDKKEPEELQKQTVAAMYCSRDHTFFKSNLGRLYVAGSSNLFQTESKKKILKSRQTIGNEKAPTLDRWLPSIVYIPTMVNMLAVGMDHCLILAEHFQVYVWGSNKKLQLGLGPTVELVRKPFFMKEMSRRKIIFAAASSSLSYFISCHGEVYGCGTSDSGSLGMDKTKKNYVIEVPKIMRGVPPLKFIACGEKHCLALCLHDPLDVYVWGMGAFGRLGVGSDLRDRQFPESIREKMFNFAQNATIKTATCGALHSLILDSLGNVYGAGVNKFAGFEYKDALELEYTDEFRKLPEQMEMIWSNSYHNVGITKGKNDLYFWGEDRFQFEDSIGRYTAGNLVSLDVFDNQIETKKSLDEESNTGKAKAKKSVQVAIGPHHFSILRSGICFSWGAYFNGRLGVGIWKQDDEFEKTFLKVPTQVFINFREGSLKIKNWIQKKLDVEGKAVIPESFIPVQKEIEERKALTESPSNSPMKGRKMIPKEITQLFFNKVEEEDPVTLELLKDIEVEEEKIPKEAPGGNLCEIQEVIDEFNKKEIRLEALQFADADLKLILNDLFITSLREKGRLISENRQLQYLTEAILVHQMGNYDQTGALAIKENKNAMLYPEFISRNIQLYQAFLGLLLVHPCYLYKLIRHNRIYSNQKLLMLILRIYKTSDPERESKINYLLIKLCYMLFKSKFKRASALEYKTIGSSAFLTLYQEINLQMNEMKQLLCQFLFKMIVSFLSFIPTKEKCIEMFETGEVKKVSNLEFQEKRDQYLKQRQKLTMKEQQKEANRSKSVSELDKSDGYLPSMQRMSEEKIEGERLKTEEQVEEDKWWRSIFPSILSHSSEFFDPTVKQKSIVKFNEKKKMVKNVVVDVFLYFQKRFSDLSIECFIPSRIAKMNIKFISKIKRFSSLLGFRASFENISRKFILMSTFSSLSSLTQQISSFDQIISLLGEAKEELMAEFDREMVRITENQYWKKQGYDHINLLFFEEKSLLLALTNFFIMLMEDESKPLEFNYEAENTEISNEKIALEMRKHLDKRPNANKKPEDDKKIQALLKQVKQIMFQRLSEPRLTQSNNFQLWKAIYSYEFSDKNDWFRVRVLDLIELRKLYIDMAKLSRRTQSFRLFPHQNDYLKQIVDLFELDELKFTDISSTILMKKVRLEVENKPLLRNLQLHGVKLYKCKNCKGIFPSQFCREKLIKTAAELDKMFWECEEYHHKNEFTSNVCSSYIKEKDMRCTGRIPKKLYDALSPFEQVPIHIIQERVYIFKKTIRDRKDDQNEFYSKIENIESLIDDTLVQDYIEILSAIPPMKADVNRILHLEDILKQVGTEEKGAMPIINLETEKRIRRFIRNFYPQLRSSDTKITKNHRIAFKRFLEDNNNDVLGRYQKLLLQLEFRITCYLDKVARHEDCSEVQSFIDELKSEINSKFTAISLNNNIMRASVLKMIEKLKNNSVVSSKTILTVNQKSALSGFGTKEKVIELLGRRICVIYIFRELVSMKVIQHFLFDKGGKLPSV